MTESELLARATGLSAEQLALAAALLEAEGIGPAAEGAIPRRREASPAPLSFPQRRLWFLHRLDPAAAAYNVPGAFRVRGALRVAALAGSLEALVRRHETLRTVFREQAGEPVQVIAAEGEAPLPVVDLSALPAARREEEARRLSREEARRPFDLSRGPLLRATLLRLAVEEHVALFTLHHVVSDGWSMGVLVRELGAQYAARARGAEPELPELPVQYADYAVWQRERLRGETLERHLAFWRDRLAGAPAVLELPTDRPRPTGPGGGGAGRALVLSPGLSAALRGLARREGATLFATLLAAWQLLLARWAGEDDVCVGVPAAGRTRLETEGLIGFFVNALVMHARLGDDPPFRDLLARVRDGVAAAHDHEELPFERLVEALGAERSPGHTPLFQVMFALEEGRGAEPLRLGDLELVRESADAGAAKFDLTLGMADDGDRIRGSLVFRTDLWEGETIERMVAHLETLLRGIAEDPGRRASALPLLSAPERRRVLAEWNGTRREYPPVPVHRLFAEQARRTPGAPAVVSAGETLSYAELDRRSDRLARVLRGCGVGPEVPVALCAERGAGLLVGLLAILKAGGALLPLEPGQPQARLARLLADAGARHALGDPRLRGRLPDAVALVDPAAGVEGEAGAEGPPTPEAPPESLAYVVYTSGSTGQPKGVAVSHASLWNLVQAARERFGFRAGDVVPSLASHAFDIWLFEVLPPLLSGGTVRMLPPVRELAADDLLDALEGATALHAVPALMREVAAGVRARRAEGRPVPEPERVFVGGDRVPPDLLAEVRGAFPGAAVHVLYGPTEATVLASSWPVPGEDTVAGHPIGAPLANARLYVCEASGEPAPVGVPGELWIGGAGVARGYAGRPGSTAERFVPDPFSGEPGARLYRTGDRVRRLADGTVEFLGRMDQQVKVRGFRVEPGEVESALRGHPSVREAVVVARADAPGDARLVAYLVPEPDGGAGGVELWPSIGEYPVYDELIYHGLTGDDVRNRRYRAALERLVRGKVVLDVGTGADAVLARICAEAGARKVYAVEVLAASWERARERVAALGLDGTVTVIHGDARTVDLPEPVDVCVSEIVESIGGAEGAAEILRAVRSRVRAGGEFVPRRSVTRIAAASLPAQLSGRPAFTEVSAHYVERIFGAVGHPFDLRLTVRDFPASGLLSAPGVFEELDFQRGARAGFDHEVVLEVERAGRFDGFLLWLELHLGEGDVLDTLAERTAWFPVFLPAFHPGVEVAPGDRLEVRCSGRLSDDGLHPDYRVHGRLLRRDGGGAELDLPSPHHGACFREHPFYEALFPGGTPRVAAPGAGDDALRAHLAESLPEYMLPVAFVRLDALPRGATGKVDRRALPAPGAGEEPGDAAPRTPTEEVLAGIFAGVLGVERVGRERSFFALGGHSLLATRAASRIREAFRVEVPLRALFEAPTPAGLAERVDALLREGVGVQAPPLVPVPRDPLRALPASFAQGRLWLVDRLEPGSPAYNMAGALRLRGPLDTAALRACLDALVRRHESLRTTLAEQGGAPVQVIHPPAPVPLAELDLRELPDAEREAERLAAEEALRPFDLARGPLLRSALLRLGDAEHVLLFTLHHVVSDGWSMDVLVREVSTLYAAFGRGEEPRLPELPIQYADFSVWQRGRLAGETLEAQLDFWRARLAGAPPLLEIPVDHPRAAGQGARAGAHPFRLGAEVSEGLRSLSRREGATLFMTVLAGWQALLGRYAAQDDVVVGTPVAGRTRTELEGLVGFLVNLLPLRADLSGDPTWRELLGRVREGALGAYAHQELPFERLVEELEIERSLAHAPLVQVTFALERPAVGAGRLSLGDVELEPFVAGEGIAKFDLSLTGMDDGAGLGGVLVYRRALFEPATAERLLGHFAVVLEALAADPSRRVSEVTLLAGSERAQVLESWNATFAGYSRSAVHELVAEQAARTPDGVAVVFEGRALTYAELDRSADRLARHLRRLGVGPEVRVGVFAERSLELVVALLGTLKAGGAYVPLDPGSPTERIAYMLADSAVAVLLTREALLERLPEHAAVAVCLDRDGGAIAAGSDEPVESGAAPECLAYVVYTSGSTGLPKGVGIPHGALANHMQWMQRKFPLAPGDRVLQKTPFTFDASIWEFWAPLVAGATLVMAPPEAHREPARLARLLGEARITVAQFVPALLGAVLEEDLSACRTVRRVFSGGEALPSEMAARCRASLGAEVVNLYGPTETCIETLFAVADASADGGWVPIGRPVSNTRAYVVDGGLNAAPPGVAGELYLGGAQLGRGYLGRADLTAAAFVPDPFSGESGARLYRTGDRARWGSGGVLEYLGREDGQVKVRGHRIEPGEVEAVLREHADVREAAVVLRDDPPGDPCLVAYVVLRVDAGGPPAPGELRERLRASLPEYMVPAVVVPLERLPLTPNGKLDRRALPAPDRSAAGGEHVAPRTPAEEMLAGIFADVLGVERVGAHDDLFALGGHSLLAARIAARARDAFGTEVPLRALFEAPTVAALAERVEALRRDGTGVEAPPLVPVARGPGRALPLSFAQQRLWFLDRLDPGSPAYNVPTALRLRGLLDVGALARALAALVRRHEVLRTRFRTGEGEARQELFPPERVRLAVVDLARLSAPAREGERARIAAAEARRPFDLERGPLLRATLLRETEDAHALLFTLHHIVSDGWSTGVLVREVSVLYDARVRGEEPRLPPLPVQYADYAVWQRAWLSGEVLEREVAWWREHLAGAPRLLELPTDHPRRAAAGARAARLPFVLGGDGGTALRALARREGATLFMALLAGFQALLARHTGQEDPVVGTPIAGRGRTEVEGLIGFFVNTLVLRGDLSGDPTTRELLGRVREAALGAYDHQDLPFERLVDELGAERSLAHTPLFQALFVLEAGGAEPLRLGAAVAEPLPTGTGAAKFDLTLTLLDAEPLRGALTYRAELWEPATMQRMLGHLETLLEGMAADPEARVREISLLSDAERIRVVEEWNATAAPLPEELCVHRLFERQAERTPGAVAVSFGDEALTYAELDGRADRLAARLRGEGVGPEVRVGICAEPGPGMVAAVLGVLKAGGAYVPLDPRSPRERLGYLLRDSGVRLVLSEGAAAARLPDAAPVLRVDAEEEGREEARGPAAAVGPRNLAYAIYTSGSTGRPKGVLVEHRGVCNSVAAYTRIYGIGPGARVLLFAPLHFDASVLDVFTALCSGATLCVASREELVPGPGLLERLRGWGITHAKFTPSALAVVPQGELPALRTLVVGGEACPGELVARWAPGRRFFNGYGPTEASVRVTAALCTEGTRAPPLGRPVANTAVYVLDGGGEPVPVGVPGELYIGGVGVARGYLEQPGLTAERFVPDALGGAVGGRLYRTGDRARWLATGEVEFLGRTDQQVKVRGFRVEPGEIESALLRHPEVREAVVAAHDAGGDPRLVAYYVADAPVEAERLRSRLGEELPEHMVPAAYVHLASLPLSPSGKLDRGALPAPRADAYARREYRAPLGGTEAALAGIWSEVLGVERVGRWDGFFALGGHSLLATRMTARVRATFGVDLPLRAVFEAPTVAGMAARVEALLGQGAVGEAPPLVPAPRQGPLPLSFAQQRLWFIHHFAPGTAAYNMPHPVRMRGPLDICALRRSLGALVARHESLRTVFAVLEDEPVQVVRDHVPVPIPVAELGGLPTEARERETRRLVGEESRRPFDLMRGPLVRALLVRGAAEEHTLLFTLHHIVADGWSLGVLVREVSTLYDAFTRGEEPHLPPLPIQYGDYAAWQRGWLAGEALERQVAWWRERLAGAPPLLEIPTDHPRSAAMSEAGATQPVTLPAATSRALLALSRAEGATLFMTLLAGWQALLSRWSGQEDVVVGTPLAGRTRLETEGLIGMFANTLALRVELSDGPDFRALLGRVRETTLGAYAHQEVPFEKLVEELRVERSLRYTPVFQALFALQNIEPGELEMSGLEVEPLPCGQEAAKFDLSLLVSEDERGVRGGLSYRAALWEPATMARMAEHLRVLLEAVVAAPERPVAELPLMPPDERAQVLYAWNATAADYPRGRCVHELFSEQARRTPGAVAVACGGETLTYAALHAAAGKVAHALRARGIGPEERVGVLLERSPEMLAALLGVLMAGGAYVPLDPDYPPERLRLMVEDAEARLLLTREHLRERVPEFRGTAVPPNGGAAHAEGSVDAEAPAVAPDRLAYVIYTSGSTGRPKGVAVTHGSVVNLLAWLGRELRFTPVDGMLALAPVSFDMAVLELFLPLVCGGRVVVADRAAASDGHLLRGLVEDPAVTVIQGTPATWYLLLEAGWEGGPGLRLLCGGEALPPDLAPRLLEQGGEVWNLYGPTEATVWSTAGRLAAGPGALSIGRGGANTRVLVLDRRLQPTPVGLPGRLYVGGAGLARGYWGRPDLTAERWVPDPFAEEPGARLYDTGDLARRLPDGRLEHLGRADAQVKVRGFRIEPGEVEGALAAHPSVRRAVVEARDGGPGGRRLVAYVVPAEGGATADALRRHLQSLLPPYMVPAAFVFLDELPLTPTGKTDRRALPEPGDAAPAEGVRVSPRDPVEEVLAETWAEVLGVERVGAHDDFFELGGQSLLAMRVASRARAAFGREVPVRALFEASTLAGFAGRVRDLLRSEGAPPRPPLAPVPRDRPLPLSFAQQRLWFLHRLDPASAAYNLSTALRLRGAPDPAALDQALREVVRRHETLRTAVVETGGEAAQRILPPGPVFVPVVDLSGLPGEVRGAEASRRTAAEAQRPFDLTRAPLFRTLLLRASREEWVLGMTMHHVVSDGWSMGVLVREVSALYAALTRGEPSPLSELPVQYADHAVWQRSYLSGEVLERELAYWREALEGAPPRLELPTDRARPAVAGGQARTVPFLLPAEVRRALRALARGEGATLFMALLAGWQALLGRYAGQEDFVVGTPIAGRTHAELEGLIGFFVNTLALRADLSGDPTVGALLGRVRERTLGAYAHQELPFERLVEALGVERSLAQTPLFQVMLVLQNLERAPLRLGGVRVEPLGPAEGGAKFDLSLALTEQGEALAGTLTYRSALWEASTAGRMVEHLEALLRGMGAGPGRRLGEIGLLGAAEREQVLRRWNRTGRAYPAGATLHGLVEAQARRTPQAPALVYEGRRLEYGELQGRAERLAERLRGVGVGPEVRVGVSVERSPELVVALLGVLRAGGAYVPLDPSYPAERLGWMLRDAAVPVVLAQEAQRERLRGVLAEYGGAVLWLGGGGDAGGAAEEGAEEARGGAAAAAGAQAENLAYVIYTSGSTGRPKGAMNEHRGIVNRLLWMQERYGLDASDVVLQKTPTSFDVSVWELFWPLLSGARLVLARPEGHRDAAYLWERIESEGVTTVHFVPPMLQAFLEARGGRKGGTLRRVFSSGEALSAELAERFREALPGVELHNLYGPTEAAVDVTHHACAGGEGVVPIGRPVANTRIYVLDGAGEPAPVGVPGELYIGGVQVGRGYLGDAAGTAERYVPDAYGGEAGGRLYRTGDRGRWRESGEVEYLGRLDAQVKVRGYRIEPGEIEAALRAEAGVREAVVVVRGEGAGEGRLVGYVVGEGIEGEALREGVRARLPEHMVPTAVVVLEALPLTPNGKLDRRALPAPASPSSSYVAPRTRAEEVLARVWTEVLGVEMVGVHDSFFELGGDSILSLLMVARALRAGLAVTPQQVFAHPTVARLAAVAGVDEGTGAEQGGVVGGSPLTPIQHWFFEQELRDPAHWNLSLLLEPARRIAPAVVGGAVARLMEHHDALRMRFRSTPEGWSQENVPAEPGPPTGVVDLSGLPAAARTGALERAAEHLQEGLHLERGPLLRAGLFELGEERGQRLLLAAHHLVVDGVSWRVLLEDLGTACGQLERGGPALLPPKTTSFRRWAALLAEHAGSGALDAELPYWTADARHGAAPLPVDLDPDPAANTVDSARSVVLSLTGDETEALLREVPAAYRAGVEDALLAALGRTLASWTGCPRVLVELEGHGREELFEGVDLSRTVGWLTSLYPVLLELEGATGPGEALRVVKEQLRGVPRRGVGYGLLRWLGPAEARERLRALPRAGVLFSHSGRFDRDLAPDALFRPVREVADRSRSPRDRRTHPLEVLAAVEGGRLQVCWIYGAATHRRETVERLAERFAGELRGLLVQGPQDGPGGYTPSDFPRAKLDQRSLEKLLKQINRGGPER